MTQNNSHLEEQELEKLHIAVDGKTDGGACLSAHGSASFKNHGNQVSCNYRYQGWKQAQDEGKINAVLHSYSTRLRNPIATAKNFKPSNSPYPTTLVAPRKGDWDVTGPTNPIMQGRKVRVPPKKNFTTEVWPYWNNAHHIIPKAMFLRIVNAEKDRVPVVMKKALLKAKYNINHKINMFMLPQDREVARILKLARHIQMKEGDAPGVSPICCDHPKYNNLVEDKLKSILSDYRALCKKARKTKKHAIPNATLDAKKLERLSRTLMNKIIAWGQAEAGTSLDKHAMAETASAGKTFFTGAS